MIVETEIEQRREIVYDILVDFRNYDSWLPRSLAFKGTTSISEGPIRVGTTYVEASVWGTRRGTVNALSRPDRMSYSQPMTLNPAILGVIGVRVEDSLTAVGAKTRVTRRLDLGFQGPVRFVAGFVAKSFKTEIE